MPLILKSIGEFIDFDLNIYWCKIHMVFCHFIFHVYISLFSFFPIFVIILYFHFTYLPSNVKNL